MILINIVNIHIINIAYCLAGVMESFVKKQYDPADLDMEQLARLAQLHDFAKTFVLHCTTLPWDLPRR